MIGVRLTVPVACWRKGHAREYLESEQLPPPSTCYGALLSLVGETDRDRHRGCRVTAGLLNQPEMSTVLRTLWQIKDKQAPQGTGKNAGPDLQQLVIGAELILWCSSRDEQAEKSGLEARVKAAFRDPSSIQRFGGWSLGESTHLINDASLQDPTAALVSRTFLLDENGLITMPVWVDHVGSSGTRYAVGNLEAIAGGPPEQRIPRIHD